MSKPWDHLRATAPLKTGSWRTRSGVPVNLLNVWRGTVGISIPCGTHDAKSLDQIREFLTELINQLEE